MDQQVNSSGADADSILLQYSLQQQTTGETPVTLKTSSQVYTDSTSAAGEDGDVLVTPYSGSSARPNLPQPAPNSTSVDGATLLKMYNSGSLFMSSATTIGTPLAKKFLDDCAQIPVTDPEIIALAQKQGESPGLVYKQIQFSTNTLFEQQLTNLPAGLPDNAAALLRYANANPQAVASLPASLQTLLKTMQGTVNTQLKQEYGFSSSWQGVPPDNTFFNSEVLSQYDDGFENRVNQYALSKNLSDEQVAQLMAMHYMPGVQSSDPALTAIFNQINQQNVANMQASYGTGYIPQADTGSFTQQLNGAFRQYFQDALQSQQPPLSSADQSAVIALYSNPNDPNVSADDKARLTPILQSITASSVAQVRSDFGLEALGVQWSPVVTTIINPTVDPALIQSRQNGLNIANEILGGAKKFVDQMPEGPQKESYKDFLKAIAQAISKFQQFLYTMQGSNAALSNKMTAMNFDEQNSALQKQQDALRQQEQQHQGKGINMPSWLNDMTGWIEKVVGTALLGPIIGGFLLIDKIRSEATGKPSLTQEMFGAVQDACVKALGPDLGNKIAPAVNCAISIAVSSGSPTVCVSMMTEDSKCIQGLIGAVGGNPEQQQLAAMGISMGVQIVYMVAISLLSGGASMALVSAQTTKALATAMNLTVEAVNTISDVGKAAMAAYQITTAALNSASSIEQALGEFAQSKIEKFQGEADAYSALVAGLMQAVKKLITMLQQQLTSNGAMITTASKGVNELYDTAIQASNFSA